jgi:hypothetical protein
MGPEDVSEVQEHVLENPGDVIDVSWTNENVLERPQGRDMDTAA